MARPIKVVPAILTEDPKSLKEMIHLADSFTDYIQIDIMDGRFVPSQSITYKDLIALPPGIIWEAHLMVERPENHLEDFAKAGAQKVIFHYEATSSPQNVISQARELGLKIGLAINPETDVTAFRPLVNKIDSILFLTVHPGFYGSRFIPEVLDNVKVLRQNEPDIEIGVDGGIKESNIVQIALTGVDVLYIGSAIFLQSHPAEKYREFMALVQTATRVDNPGT